MWSLGCIFAEMLRPSSPARKRRAAEGRCGEAAAFASWEEHAAPAAADH